MRAAGLSSLVPSSMQGRSPEWGFPGKAPGPRRCCREASLPRRVTSSLYPLSPLSRCLRRVLAAPRAPSQESPCRGHLLLPAVPELSPSRLSLSFHPGDPPWEHRSAPKTPPRSRPRLRVPPGVSAVQPLQRRTVAAVMTPLPGRRWRAAAGLLPRPPGRRCDF